MRLIAGLDAPTQGTISIGSAPVTGQVPDIGIVFQRDLLLEWRNVMGNVMLPAEVKRLAGLETRAGELLQELDVAGFAKAYPWQLSGGMRQRVAIARALLTRPALLFLDEPFSALDALTRDQMNVLLQRLQTTQNVTTLLITHSIPEAIFCADRVLVMSGRPGAILDDIAVPFDRPRRLAVRETSEFAAIGRDPRAFREGGSAGRMKGRALAADMIWPLLSGAAGLALWEGLVKGFDVPVFLLPAPTDIAETIVAKWSYLLSQLAITVMAAGLGLVISVVLGLVAGAAIAGSRFVDRILTPWLVVAHAIPKVVIAPLFFVWFGFGLGARCFCGGLHLLPGDREHGDGPEVGRPRAAVDGARHGRDTPAGSAEDPVPERAAQHLCRHQARRQPGAGRRGDRRVRRLQAGLGHLLIRAVGDTDTSLALPPSQCSRSSACCCGARRMDRAPRAALAPEPARNPDAA